MMDQDSLSEGELEDGEVLSSEEEEEGQGDTKVCKTTLCMCKLSAILNFVARMPCMGISVLLFLEHFGTLCVFISADKCTYFES